MAIFTIKDSETDDQARVINGALQVSPIGGGGLSDVNIFDSAGNPLTSTGGALNVNDGGVGWVNFGQSTPIPVSVSSVSTILLNQNLERVSATFANNSNAAIYIQYGISAVWQQGYFVPPNCGWEINSTNLYQGQVSAITQSATVNIDVVEGVKT